MQKSTANTRHDLSACPHAQYSGRFFDCWCPLTFDSVAQLSKEIKKKYTRLLKLSVSTKNSPADYSSCGGLAHPAGYTKSPKILGEIEAANRNRERDFWQSF